ncbi:MAG: hypothetical protein K6B74_02105 [Ruminococcus sp.]|nr:hypothetical protein [Ruminococcus sp.]
MESFIDLRDLAADLVLAVILSADCMCAVYTGIMRRKKQKTNIVFTVILVVCCIAEMLSPFLRTDTMHPTPSGRSAFVLFAYSFAAITLLYIVIYRLSFRKDNDRMIKLTFGFSVYLTVITFIPAVLLCVSIIFGLFMMIPKY